MKKTFILLLSSMLILISGCGNATNTVDLTQTPSTESESIESEATQESTEQQEKLFDKDVDIVLSMFSFDDGTDISTYVEQLKTDNPDDVYKVYDDSHYAMTIKESERKEQLSQLTDPTYVEQSFQQIFSDEQYNGAFLSMDYDDLFENVTFYADKSAYDNAGLSVTFGPLIISGMYADIIQGYNLVPLEDRKCTVKIIDNDTQEIIYDSSEDTTSTED